MSKHEKLRAWRKARNLTQAQMAEVLGVSRSALRDWESGRKSIRKLVWLALAGLEVRDEALSAITYKEAA